MSNVYSIHPPPADAECDDVVERYETMPAAAIAAELRAAGIDPAPTVAAVADILRKHRERTQHAAALESVDP